MRIYSCDGEGHREGIAGILWLQGLGCKGDVWKPKVVLLWGTLSRSPSRIPNLRSP